MLGIQLLIMAIFGVIAMLIARAKGRSGIGWFFGGFFLTWIGVIIVACLSNRKEDERRLAHSNRERRLLREQLYQERMKLQAHQEYTNARLGVHDDHLGIDTTQQTALPGIQGVAPPPLPAATPSPQDALSNLASGATIEALHAVPATAGVEPALDAQWYVYIGEKKFGPGDHAKMVELIHAKKIQPSTPIWAEGMGQPVAASGISAFSPYFS